MDDPGAGGAKEPEQLMVRKQEGQEAEEGLWSRRRRRRRKRIG